MALMSPRGPLFGKKTGLRPHPRSLRAPDALRRRVFKLDVVEDDASWGDWPERQLEAASRRYALLINPVVYAELSIAIEIICPDEEPR